MVCTVIDIYGTVCQNLQLVQIQQILLLLLRTQAVLLDSYTPLWLSLA